MKRLGTLLLIWLIFFQAGCGKKQEAPPAAEPEAVLSGELPVLEQNKVAPNPSVMGVQDISFEPNNDDQQKSAPVDELDEPQEPAAD